MVISDFNLICLGQPKPHFFQPKGVFFEVVDSDEGAYNPEWQSLKKESGVWYSIFPVDDAGTRTYDDEFFDIGKKSEKTFSVVVIEKYKKTLLEIVEYFLEESPIHRIIIMLWLDGDEKQPGICCPLGHFRELLYNNNLLFGVIYVVHREDTVCKEYTGDGSLSHTILCPT